MSIQCSTVECEFHLVNNTCSQAVCEHAEPCHFCGSKEELVKPQVGWEYCPDCGAV
jgi:hypothetical protein